MPKHNQFIKNIKSQFVSINNTLESYFNELKFFIKNLRRSKFSKNSKAFNINSNYFFSNFLLSITHTVQ